jgi:hypothetical protein
MSSSRYLSPPRTSYAVAIYTLVMSAVVVTQPAFAFRPDGGLYDFGCGEGRSVFSFGVLSTGTALAASFLMAFADLARQQQ